MIIPEHISDAVMNNSVGKVARGAYENPRVSILAEGKDGIVRCYCSGSEQMEFVISTACGAECLCKQPTGQQHRIAAVGWSPYLLKD